MITNDLIMCNLVTSGPGGGWGAGAWGGASQGANTGADLQNRPAELQIQHKVETKSKETLNKIQTIFMFRDLVTIPKADEAHNDLR